MKPESLILSTALGVFLIIASIALFGDNNVTQMTAPVNMEQRADMFFDQPNNQQNLGANQNQPFTNQGWNEFQQEPNNWNQQPNGFQQQNELLQPNEFQQPANNGFQRQQNPFVDPNGINLIALQQNAANDPAQTVAQANEKKLIAQQEQLNLQLLKTIQLTEAHWQGMELMELTTEVKQKLNYPLELSGLLVDEVTLNSLLSGALAGDVLLAVDNEEIDSLKEFKNFTKTIRNNRKAKLQIWRKNEIMNIFIRATDFLGVAQVESAPMILAGALMPHPYRGECTNCHLIGTTGHMSPAPDAIILPPPPIARGAQMPHRDFGPCESCHVVN